jgi:hypothetical protein
MLGSPLNMVNKFLYKNYNNIKRKFKKKFKLERNKSFYKFLYIDLLNGFKKFF